MFNGSFPFPQAFACVWLYSFFFFVPANASADDATSITATAATIAKVMNDFKAFFGQKIKTVTGANILAATKILEILFIVDNLIVTLLYKIYEQELGILNLNGIMLYFLSIGKG
jgi:hypothetical protein